SIMAQFPWEDCHGWESLLLATSEHGRRTMFHVYCRIERKTPLGIESLTSSMSRKSCTIVPTGPFNEILQGCSELGIKGARKYSATGIGDDTYVQMDTYRNAAFVASG